MGQNGIHCPFDVNNPRPRLWAYAPGRRAGGVQSHLPCQKHTALQYVFRAG